MNQQQTRPKIRLITTENCPFCLRAKALLQELKLDFEEKNLSSDLQELARIKAATGWKTVPLIWIGEELIGGYTDLKSLSESGELEKKLKL